MLCMQPWCGMIRASLQDSLVVAAAASQVQQQASELQQAVQRPLGALGKNFGQLGSGMQRSLDDVFGRGTAPTRQVMPFCRGVISEQRGW